LKQVLELRSGGIEIKWNKKGQKGYPTLIFLHEGLGCVDMWRDFPLHVSAETGCPCFIYSRLGYGRSERSEKPWKVDFMHRQADIILPEIIQKTGITSHVIIGHSDGGSIGTIYAGTPGISGLMGLVTLAAHMFCEELTKESIRLAREHYIQGNLKQRLSKYHGVNTDHAFWGWNDIWLHPDFVSWNIEEYLRRITVPMMAIQGADDFYGTVRQIDAIKDKVMHAETHLIANCGHAPHSEQPEIVVDLIARFIRQLVS